MIRNFLRSGQERRKVSPRAPVEAPSVNGDARIGDSLGPLQSLFGFTVLGNVIEGNFFL